MKYSKRIGKVIAYANTVHSLEGSDVGELLEVKEAIKYSNSQVIKITGFTTHELPSQMYELIIFLNNLFQHTSTP